MDIARDLAYALDPVTFAVEVLEWEPDDWQADLLRSDSQQIIMNCCRQSGKSTVAAVLALHSAIYDAPALILLLSPALRQSQELFRKFKDFFGRMGGYAPAVETSSALRMELGNGSRIISLPGKEATVRGYSAVSLLIVDEASRTSDDLYLSIRPMLAVAGGKIALLATPWGKRGFFYETWTEGGDDWKKVKVTAEQCPRIPAEFLKRERAALGEWWYNQEYLCEFSENEAAVFDLDEIESAFERDDDEPVWNLPEFGVQT